DMASCRSEAAPIESLMNSATFAAANAAVMLAAADLAARSSGLTMSFSTPSVMARMRMRASPITEGGTAPIGSLGGAALGDPARRRRGEQLLELLLRLEVFGGLPPRVAQRHAGAAPAVPLVDVGDLRERAVDRGLDDQRPHERPPV